MTAVPPNAPRLNDEILEKVFCEIENIVNGQPLTNPSDLTENWNEYFEFIVIFVYVFCVFQMSLFVFVFAVYLHLFCVVYENIFLLHQSTDVCILCITTWDLSFPMCRDKPHVIDKMGEIIYTNILCENLLYDDITNCGSVGDIILFQCVCTW